MSKLTPKQQRFIDEYLIDLNATQAAIRAGYSAKTAKVTGAKLLTNANLKAYIEEQIEKIHNERTADTREIIEYLTAVLRGETVSHVLAMCGDGCQKIIQKPPDEKERLKAAELLGKRYGIFTEKISAALSLPVVISGDDEIEK